MITQNKPKLTDFATKGSTAVAKRPSRKFHFTKKKLEALTPPPGDQRVYVYDAETRGLTLAVSPSGKKTFVLYRKIQGRPERKTIGPFPDLTIEQARGKAAELNGKLSRWKANEFEGQNPLAHSDGNSLTFARGFEMYLEGAVKARAIERHKNPDAAVAGRKWFYEHYLETALGAVSLKAITPERMASLHAKITERNGAIAANRATELARAVFRYLVKKNLATADPTLSITANGERERTKFLNAIELARLMDACEREPNKDLVDFVLLLLATGARKSNVYAMRWADLDWEFETWTIPGTESKNGDRICIPFTKTAKRILESRFEARKDNSPWIFPSRTSESGHIEDFKNQWSRLLKAAGLTSGSDAVCMHTLRHTAASWQVTSGSSLALVGGSLGHRSSQSTEVYAHLLVDGVRRSMESGEELQQKMIAQARKRIKEPLRLSGADAK